MRSTYTFQCGTADCVSLMTTELGGAVVTNTRFKSVHGAFCVAVSVAEGVDAQLEFDACITDLLNQNRHMEADDIIDRMMN